MGNHCKINASLHFELLFISSSPFSTLRFQCVCCHDEDLLLILVGFTKTKTVPLKHSITMTEAKDNRDSYRCRSFSVNYVLDLHPSLFLTPQKIDQQILLPSTLFPLRRMVKDMRQGSVMVTPSETMTACTAQLLFLFHRKANPSFIFIFKFQ